MEIAIQATDISRQYKNGIIAISHFSYSFYFGKFYVITGPSGAGKSTLLNMLGTLEHPTNGKVYYNKTDIYQCNDRQICAVRANQIGFVFQSYVLNKNLTACENVMLPLLLTQKNIRDCYTRAVALLTDLGLGNQANQISFELSGGEQQRVCMARCLANHPQIIFADEPSGNLDKENEQILFRQLKKMSQNGCCVIVVSHSDRIFSYADQILQMKEGTMREENRHAKNDSANENDSDEET